jgi:OOP family OmpA-OmpF porin
MSLTACAERQTPTSNAPTAEPTLAEPVVPPPSLAAQHEKALSDLGANISDQSLSVTLGSADFPSGTAEFAPANTDRIDRVAGLLKERQDLKLDIVGYIDDRGSDAANERLSQQRAEAVGQMLVTKFGLAEDRIVAKGTGEADPVASNDTKEGRARNRRVELRVIDPSGGYSSLSAI